MLTCRKLRDSRRIRLTFAKDDGYFVDGARFVTALGQSSVIFAMQQQLPTVKVVSEKALVIRRQLSDLRSAVGHGEFEPLEGRKRTCVLTPFIGMFYGDHEETRVTMRGLILWSHLHRCFFRNPFRRSRG